MFKGNSSIEKNGDKKIFFGTFFICFGLFAFEILCTRLLAVVVGPLLVIFAIAIAMMGMSASTSFLSLCTWPTNNSFKYKEVSWICLFLCLSYLISLFCISLFNNSLNKEIDVLLTNGGLGSLISSFHGNLFYRMCICGSFLFLPYLIFGFLIGIIFRSAPVGLYHKIYFSDLAGAAIGCFLTMMSFEIGGYSLVIVIIFVSTFMSMLSFVPARYYLLKCLALLLCLSSIVFIYEPKLLKLLEPYPDLNLLSRNYNKTHLVKEDWHIWNNYCRVSLLSIIDKDNNTENVYALENGDGWANVPGYETKSNGLNFYSKNKTQPAFAAMFNPKNVLVIFAGVGDDMVEINRIAKGSPKISGVELNSQMVSHALSNSSFKLNEFFLNPNMKLIVSEAREFLERDSNKYDSILLSWSGASISYYVGTSGQTAQYLYTKEALESLLDHLTDDGIIILTNSSKAQALMMFRLIFEERGLGLLSKHVVILKDNTFADDIGKSAWFSGWDQNRLIIAKKNLI